MMKVAMAAAAFGKKLPFDLLEDLPPDLETAFPFEAPPFLFVTWPFPSALVIGRRPEALARDPLSSSSDLVECSASVSERWSRCCLRANWAARPLEGLREAEDALRFPPPKTTLWRTVAMALFQWDQKRRMLVVPRGFSLLMREEEEFESLDVKSTRLNQKPSRWWDTHNISCISTLMMIPIPLSKPSPKRARAMRICWKESEGSRSEMIQIKLALRV